MSGMDRAPRVVFRCLGFPDAMPTTAGEGGVAQRLTERPIEQEKTRRTPRRSARGRRAPAATRRTRVADADSPRARLRNPRLVPWICMDRAVHRPPRPEPRGRIQDVADRAWGRR